ncbi:GNAT superfamily N-acetyltransferase [Paucibacter oligotrophus]|uniref:GNAT superfamily N-acetyltransferase n=1 Tax=Roseateles oligotrophus TaxID=1769250 RepID=A0A840LBK1_9BURK|nr:GNAT family N-acetyltransferase [Roseateles oligotrophus]MBB4844073.1 GNAT superfamily N-acetyltransferase [Roseateles oligotrophus]
MWKLEAVIAQDFEPMLALRIAAVQESLERIGRFDPERARLRFQEGFEPAFMQHIVTEQDGRVGFFTLKPRSEGQVLRLVHLYLQPGSQSQGAGSWVMDRIKQQARASGCDITLAALKLSRANDFYQRHGFRLVEQREFDNEYRWSPAMEQRA